MLWLFGPQQELSPKEDQVTENDEISIHYVHTGEIWDRNKIAIDNIFSFKVLNISISKDDEYELQIVDECQPRNDWPT